MCLIGNNVCLEYHYSRAMDRKMVTVRYRGTTTRERRRVRSRKIGFGLTQRLFRAPWRWSGLTSWSPQRRWGRLYRPQVNYHLSGAWNQSLFHKSRRYKLNSYSGFRLSSFAIRSGTAANPSSSRIATVPLYLWISIYYPST